MLWFIIFPVLFFLGIVLFLWKEMGKSSLFFGVIFGVIGGFFGLIANIACSGPIGFHYTKYDSIELQSLGTNSEIHGSFFLGIGGVGERTAYHYYAKTEDGGFYEDSVSTSRATVYETDGVPHVEILRRESNNDLWLISPDNEYRDRYAFYVPRGSVVQTYTLKP